MRETFAYYRGFHRNPSQLGFIAFLFALAYQLGHEVEHFAQMIEKYVWHWHIFPGLLGQVFDFEWVHYFYNSGLFVALLATWLVYRKNPGIWRASVVGAFALKFVVLFQGYHLFEHTVRMVQYFQGNLKPPGLLGQVFQPVELHFMLNTVVSVAMLVAFFGLRPWVSSAHAPGHAGSLSSQVS